LRNKQNKIPVEVTYALCHPTIATKYGICNAYGRGKVYVTPKKAEALRQGKVVQVGFFYCWVNKDP